MATRFYFQSTGTPSISPATSGWNSNSANFVRRTCKTSKQNTALTTSGIIQTTATSPELRCAVQFISDALDAQTISGTLIGVMRAAENNTAHNGTIAIAVALVDSTGGNRRNLLTVQASDNTAATPPEFSTSLSTRRFQNSAEATSLTLTSQSSNQGDRLVIEIGVRDATTSTSTSATLNWGDPSATNDHAHSDGVTTALVPWVEFSANLVFYTPPLPSTGRLVWAELEAPNVATTGRVSFGELETSNIATRGYLSYSEFETPSATNGRISQTEFETPNVTTRGRISFSETETPSVPAEGRISHSESEFPNVATTGRISHTELETPELENRGRVSHTEFELPSVPSSGRLSQTEFETPNTPSRGRVSFTEVEVPTLNNYGKVSQTEFEVPDELIVAGGGRLTWANIGVPLAKGIAKFSHAELQVPNTGEEEGRISRAEMEFPDLIMELGGSFVVTNYYKRR